MSALGPYFGALVPGTLTIMLKHWRVMSRHQSTVDRCSLAFS